MPGFFMGILQFGWLGVNIWGSSHALASGFNAEGLYVPLCIVWGVAAAFVGLKGIQYVARVATYLPIIPLVVLIIGLVKFGPDAGRYTPPAVAGTSGSAIGTILMMVAFIVGFFATAGAAGVDICSNNRDKKDVSMGGWVGVVIAIIFTAGISVIAVAGARAAGVLAEGDMNMTDALKKTFSAGAYGAIMIGLTIASFPGACFSSFIAANSFKTVMPKVNPFVSVGIGTIVSIILAITNVAGQLPAVFGLIGASFGPIVGAMVVDYLLAGGKWSGPRAGINLPGWIAWAVGFIVGILPNDLMPAAMRVNIPCAPVAAFVVGAVVYFICAKAGLMSPVLPYSKTAQANA
jgi:cytosine permease